MHLHRVSGLPPRLRAALVLMCAEAVSLAVVSPLHLRGLLQGGLGAGTAEAVICVALAWGAVSVLRSTSHWRAVACGTTVFAIAGFAYGLSVTSEDGTLPDVVYHAAVLPLLLITFGLLVTAGASSPDPAAPVATSASGYRDRPNDRAAHDPVGTDSSSDTAGLEVRRR